MQRDRNIPDLDEPIELEKDDLTLFIDIIAKQCEVCLIYTAIVLSTFGLLFIYYHFTFTCNIIKYSVYTWGIYNIVKYTKYKFKKYIESKRKYPIFAPFGVATIDSSDDEKED